MIHSFWVPQLGGKTDTIPGLTNVSWMQADKAGIYRGQCGEYCGMQHAHMALLVVADHLADWIRHAQAIKPGAGMPNIALDDAQLKLVVAYLQTLH